MNDTNEKTVEQRLEQHMRNVTSRRETKGDPEVLQHLSDVMLECAVSGDRAAFQAAKQRFEAAQRGKDFDDPGKLKAENERLKALARDAGYTDDEIGGLADDDDL